LLNSLRRSIKWQHDILLKDISSTDNLSTLFAVQLKERTVSDNYRKSIKWQFVSLLKAISSTDNLSISLKFFYLCNKVKRGTISAYLVPT
jgi:hypothetical protein